MVKTTLPELQLQFDSTLVCVGGVWVCVCTHVHVMMNGRRAGEVRGEEDMERRVQGEEDR